MTDNKIFEMLLEDNKNEDYTYDYPKLQAESVDIVAGKLSDLIYETMKQKSTASQSKRANILKYIHSTCKVKTAHLDKASYECYLKALRKSLRSNESEEVSQLVCEINSELEKEAPTDLANRMVDFYMRKNAKQKAKQAKLEFVNNMNQQKLDMKFDIQIKRNLSYYETSENVVRELVGQSQNFENRSPSEIHTMEYREKQIKFCYALLNVRNSDSDLCLIEVILKRLCTYKKLEEFEINLLFYLWMAEEEHLALFVSEKFPLVLERFILNYSTEIIQLEDDPHVRQYFANLEKDKKFIKIKRLCAKNVTLNSTIKNLIYQLYCYSSCNKNLLTLIDLLQ